MGGEGTAQKTFVEQHLIRNACLSKSLDTHKALFCVCLVQTVNHSLVHSRCPLPNKLNRRADKGFYLLSLLWSNSDKKRATLSCPLIEPAGISPVNFYASHHACHVGKFRRRKTEDCSEYYQDQWILLNYSQH